ncbi:MAG: hypothetical protein KDA76_12435 [Planctomycetaceae bacterium]|nr:hypothetical protein [Planctomycetaceae bacterium]
MVVPVEDANPLPSDDELELESELPPRQDRYRLPRRVVLVYNLFLLIYLLQRTEYARVNNQPVSSWLVLPVLLLSGLGGFLGGRWLSPFAGIWLAGVAGFFASYVGLSGPYGAVVGLITGLIVVLLQIEFSSGNEEE